MRNLIVSIMYFGAASSKPIYSHEAGVVFNDPRDKNDGTNYSYSDKSYNDDTKVKSLEAEKRIKKHLGVLS